MPHYISRTTGPLKMPFVCAHPYEDELNLERSFKNIRGDVMDPAPAVDPFFFTAQRAGERERHGAAAYCSAEEPSSSWAIPVFQDDDYDVTSFHRFSGPAFFFAGSRLGSCMPWPTISVTVIDSYAKARAC